jgi:hypothetical protein
VTIRAVAQATSREAILLVLLEMITRAFKMVLIAGVTSSYRTLLEVTLQDIAAGERVLAQLALVRSVTGICQTFSSILASLTEFSG